MRSLSRRERIYVGVFLAALLWGLWSFRHQLGFIRASESASAPTPSATATAASLETPAADIATKLPEAGQTAQTAGVRIAPDWETDPFHRDWRRANTASVAPARATPPSPLHLSAIVVRRNVRYAVINGCVVREGDTIEGRMVIRVEPSRVLLDEKGTEVRLSL